jgi:hypothetical protein
MLLSEDLRNVKVTFSISSQLKSQCLNGSDEAIMTAMCYFQEVKGKGLL